MKKNKEKNFTRYSFLIGIIIAVLSYITLKLVDLQIIKSDYYKEYANSKSHKLIEETAPRGRILDSNGVELATNKPSYVLSFTATDESSKQFYSTMYKVFEILDSKNQSINDEFPLKISPFRFEFDAVDDAGKKALELIFKNNIGLNDEIAKKKFKKNYKDIDEEKQKIVKKAEMEYTPKQTFEYLLKKYNVPSSKGIGGISGAISESNNKTNSFYSLEEQRKFVVLKYAVEMKSYSGYKTVVISNIDKETAFYFSERLNDLPGIFVDTQSQRYYPNGEVGSAFLGYISKISDEKYKEQGYDLSTDFVGVSGIEEAIEDRLRGSKGAKVVQVNGKGRVINELAKRDASPGQDIHLTIDKDVQAAGEKALDERFKYLQKKKLSGKDNNITNANRGAVVAINVKTGGIIALVSRPGFDPNAFAAPSGLTSDLYNQYYNLDYEQIGKSKGWSMEKIDKMFPKNKNGVREDVYDFVPKPLYNYATSSLIPPGSTFKPLTAVAGLSEGVITKDSIIYDPQWFEIAPGEKKWFREDKGNYNANLALAIQYSSNPYFMTVAKKLMEKYEQPGALEKGNLRHKFDAIAKYAWQFGLGADPEDKDANLSTGIELKENFGQVYNRISNQRISLTGQLSVVLEQLKSGKNPFNNKTFPSLNVYYDEDNDSKEVHAQKKKVKETITNVIQTGKYNATDMKNAIKAFVAVDPKYKNVKYSATDYENISHYLQNYLVFTAYKDVNVNKYNMYNAAIGQGISTFTPVQIASYMATLANGGTRYKLHLVDKVTDSEGNVVSEEKPQILNKIDIKTSDLNAIKQGMYQVTQEGTAASTFKGFNIKTAGKTGSATFRNDQNELGRTSFALYAGFAPYDDPEIAICAVIFDGGYGSDAAPIVKSMFEAYFNKDQNKDNNAIKTEDNKDKKSDNKKVTTTKKK